METDIVSTSISAVDQIKQVQNPSRKKFWILIFSMATIFSICHTWTILFDYYQNLAKDSELSVANDVQIAATACTNQFRPGLLEIFIIKNLSATCDLRERFHLSQMNEKQRFQISEEITTHKLHISSEMVKEFNNLQYGNCVTYSSRNMSSAKIIVSMTTYTRAPPIVVFHDARTRPVFDKKNIFIIFGKEFKGTSLVKHTIYENAFWFYEPCVVNDRDINSTDYAYSYENCLDQCLYHLTKEFCKCVKAHAMLEVNTMKLPLCQQWCNKIPENLMIDMCGCKPSCQSVEVDAKKHLDYMGAAQEILTRQMFPKRTIKLIGYQLTSATKKESLITLEDALSAIGGIFGIWIGLSISGVLYQLLKLIKKPKSNKTKELSRVNYQVIRLIVRNLILIVIGSVCCWQIYLTMKQYFEYKVIQVTTTEDLDPTFFPGVFVCFQFENDDIHLVKYFGNLPSGVPVFYERNYKYNWILIDTESQSLFPPAKDLITICNYQLQSGRLLNCSFNKNHYFIFDDQPHFCAFISPDSNENKEIEGLKFQLDYGSPGTGVVTVGFHPFFILPEKFSMKTYEQDNIPVQCGDSLSVKYSMTRVKRMSAPYASDCSQEQMNYSSWPSDIQNVLPQYGYSFTYDECLQFCDLHQKDNNCGNDIYEWKVEKGAEHKLWECKTDLSVCGCRKPCEENQLHLEISRTGRKPRQEPIKFDSQGFPILTEIEEVDQYATVQIQKASSQMKVITEKPLIEDISIVGLVGGILGLWVGLSMLSVIVEATKITAKLLDECMKLLTRK